MRRLGYAAPHEFPVLRSPELDNDNLLPAPSTTAEGTPSSQAVSVVRYASKDAGGRVWGVPSAFGKGQCLDCPARAAPPSMLCESCQCRAATEGGPMPADQLQRLQRSFGSLLVNFSGRVRDDIMRRLGQLYSRAQQGLLPPTVQVRLIDVASTIDADHIGLASKEVAALSATHWSLHKDWLVGLKRLLSVV